jgi:hypothetical protein
MHLAAYSRAARERLDKAMARRSDLFPDGWSGDSALALAYAQRLAAGTRAA